MATAAHVTDVSEATFERDVINASRQTPIVVDFWAPWCGPCRTLGPTLEKLAAEAKGGFRLVKVNVDQNQGLAMRFNVQGIPAVKAFRDGKVVAEFVGAQPEAQVRQFIKKLGPAPADQVADDGGAGLLAAHRWADAERAFRRTAQGGAPAAASLGLAKALIAQGKGEDAGRVLEPIKDGAEGAAAEKLRAASAWLVSTRTGQPAADPNSADALFAKAGAVAARGDIQAALEGLLAVLRRDKRYRSGEAQRIMLAYFDILGDADPLTREYRGKLASVLF
jgi:putative thioredoxin